MLVLRGRGRFNDPDTVRGAVGAVRFDPDRRQRAYTLSRLKHRWLAASHNAVAANNNSQSDQCCR